MKISCMFLPRGNAVLQLNNYEDGNNVICNVRSILKFITDEIGQVIQTYSILGCLGRTDCQALFSFFPFPPSLNKSVISLHLSAA